MNRRSLLKGIFGTAAALMWPFGRKDKHPEGEFLDYNIDVAPSGSFPLERNEGFVIYELGCPSFEPIRVLLYRGEPILAKYQGEDPHELLIGPGDYITFRWAYAACRVRRLEPDRLEVDWCHLTKVYLSGWTMTPHTFTVKRLEPPYDLRDLGFLPTNERKDP